MLPLAGMPAVVVEQSIRTCGMPIRFFRADQELTADGEIHLADGIPLEELATAGDTFPCGVPGLLGAGALRCAVHQLIRDGGLS